MPVQGLPSSLEAMLNAMLQENSVTSFKVEAGASRTVLVLRFSSTTGQHGDDTTQSASFRKKNPAQITRDRRRVEAFQQQQQQQRHTLQQQKEQHQASAVDIQEETLPKSLFTSQDIPVGLSISDVNTPCRRPTTAREVSDRERPIHTQQPPLHTASKQAHVQSEQQRRPPHSQQCVVVPNSCGDGGDGNAASKDDINIVGGLLQSVAEQCDFLSQQQRQIDQQQQRHQQELANMFKTDRPPPPPSYQLRPRHK